MSRNTVLLLRIRANVYSGYNHFVSRSTEQLLIGAHLYDGPHTHTIRTSAELTGFGTN